MRSLITGGVVLGSNLAAGALSRGDELIAIVERKLRPERLRHGLS